MILACTQCGDIGDEPVLLYFQEISDFGKKNRRNMGRKQTPPLAKARYQHTQRKRRYFDTDFGVYALWKH